MYRLYTYIIIYIYISIYIHTYVVYIYICTYAYVNACPCFLSALFLQEDAFGIEEAYRVPSLVMQSGLIWAHQNKLSRGRRDIPGQSDDASSH